MPEPRIIEIGSDGYAPNTYGAERPVVLFSWCRPCQKCSAILTMFEEVANEVGDRILFCTLNFDDFQGVAVEFGIQRPATVTLLDKGDRVAVIVEPDSKEVILELIEKHFPES